MVHIHQCFNAVGHGTFFSGLAWGGGPTGQFSWIYDCGSRRTTQIDKEIACLEDWGKWPDLIDLLVLSHFDDDHVNGVERLLRSRRVSVLALPYMDVGHSLACAAAVGADPCSVSTATLQLDPIGWLTSRGLAGQVGTVLRVRGGPRNDDDPPVDGGPTPFPSSPADNLGLQDDRSNKDGGSGFNLTKAVSSSAGSCTPRLLQWRHAASMAAPGLPMEFMFYNSTQPDLFRTDSAGVLVARRSGKSHSIVQADVDVVVRSYRLHDLSRSPRRRWRDALRAIYVKHFGGASQQRNNISLCLLVRPLVPNVAPCGIFRDRHLCCTRVLDDELIYARAGMLLLGDLRVDKPTRSEMYAHFGHLRWSDVGTVQVPHHGSRHSWEPGAAANFNPNRFIHCIPETSAHHPHKTVDEDLDGYHVHRADYTTRVVLDYHFGAPGSRWPR